MNQSRLTLTLPPTLGSREIEVDARRFSIGRTPENDLAIPDASLSRRHALIENFEGRFNLSDCGSSNGTLVNGKPVTGITELSDWDVLTFGGVGDILVHIEEEAPQVDNSRSVFGAQRSIPAPKHTGSMRSAIQSWLTVPVIAAASVVLIILVTGVALLIGSNSNSRSSTKPIVTRKSPPAIVNDNDDRINAPNDNAGTTKTPETTPTNSGTTESNELSMIETYASRVLSSISKDTRHAFTEKPLSEINGQVQRYKNSSTLRDELVAMKRALPQVSATAKSSGLRTALVVYATLARMDKEGGRNDPVQVAASVCQSFLKTRPMFGDEQSADTTLLWVESLEEGAALQTKITNFSNKVSESATTIRTIWYLHDHQVVAEQSHNFILRFLAIGVIAQNPQKFGIATESLSF